MSTLILHRGAQIVSRDELKQIPVPPSTPTWFPVAHSDVLDVSIRTLTQAGFEVARTQLALTRDQARFFGTLDLRVPIATGVQLAVGIRNSIDKSLPINFCVGSRVFVCDNLAFSSEIVVARKHTRFGQHRFREAICQAVRSLWEYRKLEARRIRRFQETELSDDVADAMLLRTFEKGVVSSVTLPKVIQEWRKPTYEDFQPRNVWSLFNAYTTVLAQRQKTNPQLFAGLTIRLQQFLSEHVLNEPNETITFGSPA